MVGHPLWRKRGLLVVESGEAELLEVGKPVGRKAFAFILKFHLE
jgi:hypothetical protein